MYLNYTSFDIRMLFFPALAEYSFFSQPRPQGVSIF